MTPGESSVPKIQVGGDFKIGNVPGQAAIGENIAQTVCKDCTFILPNGSDVHGKSWLLHKVSDLPPIQQIYLADSKNWMKLTSFSKIVQR